VSLATDMLRAARRARNRLPDAARTEAFLRGLVRPDGGFAGRAGPSDLYYTVFAMHGLAALSADLLEAAPRRYLAAFGDGAALDFVHLACLARCWSLLPPPGAPGDLRRAVLRRIEAHRAADGGYHTAPGAAAGSPYAGFLALGAYQDFEADPPDREALAESVRAIRAEDGGYTHEPSARFTSTPVTAAAVCTLHELGEAVDRRAADWLLARGHPEGGFLAATAAPVPDLLSTATALHALAAAGVALEAGPRRKCIEFVRGLCSADGGFRGSPADDQADCEYTFYALLALGHLAE